MYSEIPYGNGLYNMNWPSEYKFRIQVWDPEDDVKKPFFDHLYSSEAMGAEQFIDWMLHRPNCRIKFTRCIIDFNTKKRLDMQVLKFHEGSQ